MKRGLVLLLTIVMLTTIITGCSSKESDKLKIGVLIYKYDDTYISTVRQALEAEGKNDPEITLLMNDSQNDQSLHHYPNHILTLHHIHYSKELNETNMLLLDSLHEV